MANPGVKRNLVHYGSILIAVWCCIFVARGHLRCRTARHSLWV